MIVLGIDTSGYANAIGIAGDGRVLADFIFEARTDSLQKIVANIDATLKRANLTLKDIHGFGVGLGPGSWTGIRVGVTVGKILAYSTGKPVCGVPTLEVLAYNAKDALTQICSVVSVGTKDTVYAAFYRARNNVVSRIGDYYVGDISGLSAMVKGPVVFTGPEAKSYSQLIGRRGSSSLISAQDGMARGATVALLAESRLECGDSDNVLSLAPLYLKESTARAFLGRYSNRAQA